MAGGIEPAVQAYLDAVPCDRMSILNQLHKLILRLYPQAVVTMRYKMPTYQVGDAWVALANQKHYVSLYTCGSHHIAEFRKQYPRMKTGKGCINFKPNDPLPLRGVQAVVRHAMNNPKGV